MSPTTASSTDFADCETGEVRFTDYRDNSDGTREGTLQICINHAWGTICSDSLFDTTDAEVFCRELQGFNETGKFRGNVQQYV